MLISTRGHYALRLMAELAENYSGSYALLSDVSASLEICVKYLEEVVPLMTKAGLIDELNGKVKKVKLAKSPDKCTIGSILKAAQGNVAPVSCMEISPNRCKMKSQCKILPMMEELDKMIDVFFENRTLSDIVSSHNTKQKELLI